MKTRQQSASRTMQRQTTKQGLRQVQTASNALQSIYSSYTIIDLMAMLSKLKAAFGDRSDEGQITVESMDESKEIEYYIDTLYDAYNSCELEHCLSTDINITQRLRIKQWVYYGESFIAKITAAELGQSSLPLSAKTLFLEDCLDEQRSTILSETSETSETSCKNNAKITLYNKIREKLNDKGLWGRFAFNLHEYRVTLTKCMVSFCDNYAVNCSDNRKNIADCYSEIIEEEAIRNKYAETPLFSIWLIGKIHHNYKSDKGKIREIFSCLHDFADMERQRRGANSKSKELYRSANGASSLAKKMGCTVDIAKIVYELWHSLPKSHKDDFYKGVKTMTSGTPTVMRDYFFDDLESPARIVDFDLIWDKNKRVYQYQMSDDCQKKLARLNEMMNSSEHRTAPQILVNLVKNENALSALARNLEVVLPTTGTEHFATVQGVNNYISALNTHEIHVALVRAVISVIDKEITYRKNNVPIWILNAKTYLFNLTTSKNKNCNKHDDIDTSRINICSLFTKEIIKILEFDQDRAVEEITNNNATESTNIMMFKLSMRLAAQLPKDVLMNSHLFNRRTEIKGQFAAVLAKRQRQFLITGDRRLRKTATTLEIMQDASITPEMLEEEKIWRGNDKCREKSCIRMIDRWLAGTSFRLEDNKCFYCNDSRLRPQDGIKEDWNAEGRVRVVNNKYTIIEVMLKILKKNGWLSRRELQKALVKEGIGTQLAGGRTNTISERAVGLYRDEIIANGWWRQYDIFKNIV